MRFGRFSALAARLSGLCCLFTLATITPCGASTTHYFYDAAGRYIGHTTTGIDVRSNTYDNADNRSYYQLLVPNTAPPGSGLANNQSIFQGQVLTSGGGVYNLVFQEDGNLVLEHGSTPIWASGTTTSATAQPGATLLMQTDGNLCIYDPQWVARWCSNTGGNPGATLVVQGDGNMVIYSTGGVGLWATNTSGK